MKGFGYTADVFSLRKQLHSSATIAVDKQPHLSSWWSFFAAANLWQRFQALLPRKLPSRFAAAIEKELLQVRRTPHAAIDSRSGGSSSRMCEWKRSCMFLSAGRWCGAEAISNSELHCREICHARRICRKNSPKNQSSTFSLMCGSARRKGWKHSYPPICKLSKSSVCLSVSPRKIADRPKHLKSKTIFCMWIWTTKDILHETSSIRLLHRFRKK